MTRRFATRVRWGALAAGLALVAAACGSTVSPQARQAAAGRSDRVDASLDADGTLDSLVDGTAVGGTGSGAGSSRTGSGSGVRTGTGSGSGGTGGGGSTAVGPGITDKEIFIGQGYAVNSGTANAAIGAAGIDQGDDRRNSEIVINDINAHGGIAGRKLTPVWYELDATSPTTFEQQYQAVCEKLTKDNKVFAVGGGGESETLLRCLHNAGVVNFTDDLTVSDAARMQRYPYFWELGSLNLDRMVAAQVAGVNAQGYFNGSWNTAAGAPMPGKAKVGILTLDIPAFSNAVNKTLVPALAKLGYKPDPGDIVYAPQPQSQADVSNTAASVSSAVLKFRSDGVTHVFIIEDSAVLSLLFANNAESQGYRPRHAANTQNGQQALLDQGAYPRGQLPGTMGIGWLPGIDITPAENTHDGPYSNDIRRKCIALYKANGVSYDSANAAQIALGTCNSLWFFRDVMKNVTVLNRDGFRAAADRIGTSHESPSHFLVRFDADHHDGIAAIRHWAYRPECGCMRYTSGNIPA